MWFSYRSRRRPPSAREVIERIARSDKRFTVCFIGAGELALPGNATQATTLKAAAVSALGGEGSRPGGGACPRSAEQRRGRAGKRLLKGLFSGGTLCAEAQLVFQAAGEAVASNAPIPGVPMLADASGAHAMIDLGDDEYTQRQTASDDRPRRPATKPSSMPCRMKLIGVVLVDVVIGYGAHADPAGHLAQIVLEHRRARWPCRRCLGHRHRSRSSRTLGARSPS